MNSTAKLANAFAEISALLHSKASSPDQVFSFSKNSISCTLSYKSNKLVITRLSTEPIETLSPPYRNNFQISVHINQDKGTIYNYYSNENAEVRWLQLYKTKPVLSSEELVNMWVKKLIDFIPRG